MYHGDTVPGFPAHPHRGFETITIVLKGLIDHFDSLGGEGRYGNGDVQWMTAGSGCQHAEMFPLVHTDHDNPLELFQIWLNLPAKSKMVAPSYKMHWAEEIPVIEHIDASGKKTTVRLIAGKMGDQRALPPCPDSWAAEEKNSVGIFLLQLEPGAQISLPAGTPTLQRNLYFYRGEGTLEVEGLEVQAQHRIKVNGNATIQIQNGPEVSFLAVLEGEPIAEPVAQYGPFVMNTQHEIRAAINDFQRTGFGGWPWKEAGPPSPR
jgi:redox-sensitive bicupin YhaK (pirin superfamily)